MSDSPHPEHAPKVSYRQHPYRTPNTPFTLKQGQLQNKSSTPLNSEPHAIHDSHNTQHFKEEDQPEKSDNPSPPLIKSRSYPLSKFSPTERDDPSNFNLPPLQHIYTQPSSPNSPTLTPMMKMEAPSSHPYYYNPLNSPLGSSNSNNNNHNNNNNNKLSLSMPIPIPSPTNPRNVHHGSSSSLFSNPPSMKESVPTNSPGLTSPFYTSPMYNFPPRERMFREPQVSEYPPNFNAPSYSSPSYYQYNLPYHSQAQPSSLLFPLRESPSMKLKDILSEDVQSKQQGPIFPPASAFTTSTFHTSTTSTSSPNPIHTTNNININNNNMNIVKKQQSNDTNEKLNTRSQPPSSSSTPSAPKSNPKVYKFHPNPLCFPPKTKEDKPPWTEQGLSEFLESQVVKGSKVLLKLGSDIMTLTQEEAAAKLGISPTRLCRKWSQTMGPRKWPYRAHVKVEREIAQLKAGYQNTEQMPDHIKERLNSLEELKKKILEPAFILV